MKTQFYYQGEFFNEADELPISLVNRGFLYGDGFFETMRFANATIFNLDKHGQRISQSSKLLGETLDGKAVLESVLGKLTEKYADKVLRLRLTFFRKGAGKYTPENNAGWDYLLQIESLEQSQFLLNEKGLNLGIYSEQQKAKGKLANVKSLSAQLYVQAARFAKDTQFDDVFICNTDGNIIEATASNVFAIKSGYLYTPSLSEGPVAGTMRAFLLQSAFDLGLTASTGPLTKDALLNADEILLSNAIQGVKWVEKFEGKTFQQNYGQKIIDLLNGLT